MINLLPPKGKTALRHEYILRVWTIYAVILTGICIAATALLIPTYVLINTQFHGVEGDNEKSAHAREAFAMAKEEITHANDIITQLTKPAHERQISKLITDIMTLNAASNITFTTFQVAEEKNLYTISILGTAPSRGSLAGFKTALEESNQFKTVELPLSDLARDVDLSFAITLTVTHTGSQ